MGCCNTYNGYPAGTFFVWPGICQDGITCMNGLGYTVGSGDTWDCLICSFYPDAGLSNAYLYAAQALYLLNGFPANFGCNDYPPLVANWNLALPELLMVDAWGWNLNTYWVGDAMDCGMPSNPVQNSVSWCGHNASPQGTDCASNNAVNCNWACDCLSSSNGNPQCCPSSDACPDPY